MKKWQAILLLSIVPAACSDDDGLNEAQKRGVGDACESNADCVDTAPSCLSFKGGYCGIEGCQGDADCPSGSACVAHTDGLNYCFLLCRDKPECNVFRDIDVEANCSSSVDFVSGKKDSKACVPPS